MYRRTIGELESKPIALLAAALLLKGLPLIRAPSL